MSIIQMRPEPADAAVAITPNDPEAHYTRALSYVNTNQLEQAAVEFREALRLRPNRYYQWLDLGVTLDRLNDQEGAIAALRQAVRLAPSFAQPRWQLGNLLYRQGRYEEAFAEMRVAAKSDPTLSDSLLSLAWLAADGQPTVAEAYAKPEDSLSHLQLAAFMAKQGQGAAAVRQVGAAGQPANESAGLLLRQTITNLLATNQFSDAYTVWSGSHGNPSRELGLVNGDFVESITQDDPGFGWQLTAVPNVSVSIDPNGPGGGARSICFAFDGENPAATLLLYELALVQPATHYSVNFMAKTEVIVTGGPPIITVIDAGSQPVKILAKSPPLPTGTNDWKATKLDFVSDARTTAIIVALQREGCSQNPCPIFGKLWLSKVSLTRQ